MKKRFICVILVVVFLPYLNRSDVKAALIEMDNLSTATKQVISSSALSKKEHTFLVELEVEASRTALIEEQRTSFASRTNGISDLSINFRESVKGIYAEEFNKQYMQVYRSYDVAFVSEYTPYMIIKGTGEDAFSLASENATKMVHVVPEVLEIEQMASFGNEFDEMYDLPYRDATNINACKSIYPTITGLGVKIGVYDFGLPITTNPQLAGKVTNLNTEQEIDSEHPTAIAIIAAGSESHVGIAHKATIVGAVIPRSGLADMLWGFEQLAAQGVNIINCSWGTVLTEDYDALAAWLDSFIINTSITIVAATGNYVDRRPISSPAKAHQAIAVGGTNAAGTSVSVFSSFVSMYDFKPALVAPAGDNTDTVSYGLAVKDSPYGTGEVRGTSFAAPQVAGIAALLMQCNPVLKIYPQFVRAVLVAASSNAGITNVTANSHGVSDKAGGGLINAVDAINILTKTNYFGFYNESTTSNKIVTSFHVNLEAGEKLVFGFSFLYYDAPSTQIPMSNFCIDVIRVGTDVIYTAAYDSFTEKMTFVAQQKGKYMIRVRLLKKTGNYLDHGIVAMWTSSGRALITGNSSC